MERKRPVSCGPFSPILHVTQISEVLKQVPGYPIVCVKRAARSTPADSGSIATGGVGKAPADTSRGAAGGVELPAADAGLWTAGFVSRTPADASAESRGLIQSTAGDASAVTTHTRI